MVKYLAEYSPKGIFILYRIPEGKNPLDAEKLSHKNKKWEKDFEAVEAFLFGNDARTCSDEEAEAFEKEVLGE